MALDRDAERVLEMVRLSGRPPYETLSAPEARELFLAAREVLAPDPPPVAEIRELSAPGPTGAAVPLRLYRGATTIPDDTLPALVYFHGGGWVIGDLDTHDSLCRHLANAAQCIVVAVDYRLAPSTNFRRRSRIASRRLHGSRRRPQLSESTASASPSAATVPAATSRRW